MAAPILPITPNIGWTVWRVFIDRWRNDSLVAGQVLFFSSQWYRTNGGREENPDIMSSSRGQCLCFEWMFIQLWSLIPPLNVLMYTYIKYMVTALNIRNIWERVRTHDREFFYTHCIFINDIHDSFIMSCLIFFFKRSIALTFTVVDILQRAFNYNHCKNFVRFK